MIVDIALSILQAVLMVGLAPLFAGIIVKLKSRMQHRQGCSILQPYRDIAKLFRKDEIVSRHASPLFRIIPFICLGSMLALAFTIPFFFTGTAFPFADLIALVYIFTLYRFMMVLGGLEGGSAFGGMGSSREMMMSVLIEPALLLSMMVLAGVADVGTDIGRIPPALLDLGIFALTPALVLAASSFFITLLAENARVPFDNPSTHLELTMVHEGMLLEYSGRGLGMMELSSMIRLMIFSVILGSLFFPWGIATSSEPLDVMIGFAVSMIKTIAIMTAIALVESGLSKYRLFRLPNLLTVSFLLSLLGMISLYIL